MRARGGCRGQDPEQASLEFIFRGKKFRVYFSGIFQGREKFRVFFFEKGIEKTQFAQKCLLGLNIKCILVLMGLSTGLGVSRGFRVGVWGPACSFFLPGSSLVSSLVFLVPGFPVSVFSHCFPFFSVFLCFAFSLVSLLSFLSSVSARVLVSGREIFCSAPVGFESRGVSCPLRPCVCGGLVRGWWSVVSTHCVRSAAFSVSPTFVALEVQMQMFKLMSQRAVLGRPGKESAPTRNRQTSPTSCR